IRSSVLHLRPMTADRLSQPAAVPSGPADAGVPREGVAPTTATSPPPDPPAHIEGGQIAAFQDRLLAWYAAHRRDLPWRRTRDPYAILVSEMMLQQTQVPRVLPRYLAWLERFPTPAALAAAP